MAYPNQPGVAGGESGGSYPTGQMSVVRATNKPTSQTEDEKVELHKEAMERFRTVCSFEADWRKKAEEELEFVDDGKHWSDASLKERKGRPCLTFDLISGSTDQVINNMRQAPPEPRISGVGTGQDRIDSAITEGVLRNIDNDSAAPIAWSCAFEHAVKIGRGWVKLAFEYEDDPEHPFWQKITLGRVLNPFSIYPDPAACEYAYEDMRYCFETETVDEVDFKADHPEAKAKPSGEFESQGDNVNLDWFPKGGVRIAKYWWVEKKRAMIYQMRDGSITTQKPNVAEDWINSREEIKRIVHCAKITGSEVLKTWTIPGKFIPLIPVIGRESIIKASRKYRGMIRPAMDANLAYDYARSKEAEAVSLSSISQWMASVKAIEGFEPDYARSNKEAIAILKWHDRDAQGNALQQPIRISPEPASQAVAVAVEHANEDRKIMLGTYDAGLGAPGPEESGKAIGLRQRQGDNAHFNYVDNLKWSVRHATIIELGWFPSVYSEERQIMMADPDGTQKLIDINSVFEDKATGKKKNYKFSDEMLRYHVTIGTGSSYPTRRAQQTDAILQVGQTVPGSLARVLDLVAQYIDLPDEFAERWRPADIASKRSQESGEGPTMEQVQQVAAQQSQLLEQLTGRLKASEDKLQAQILTLESKERIAMHGDETAQIIAALKADAARAMTLMKADFDSIKHRLELLHDSNSIMASEQAAQLEQKPQPGVSPAGAPAPAEGAPNATID